MNEIVEFTVKHKVVVICRSLYDNELIKIIRALYNGGIHVVEVTFDQVNLDTVEKTCGTVGTIKEHLPQMKVGDGTVTCVKHALATKKTGGEFCLSPNVNTKVIRVTKEAGLISIPGTTTPTEVSQVHNAGVDTVKMFPVGRLGLSYLKDIKGSINHVKSLVATGVNEENFEEYLNTGCRTAGTNSHFIDRKVIAEGNFEELTHRVRVFTDIANAC